MEKDLKTRGGTEVPLPCSKFLYVERVLYPIFSRLSLFDLEFTEEKYLLNAFAKSMVSFCIPCIDFCLPNSSFSVFQVVLILLLDLEIHLLRDIRLASLITFVKVLQ